MKPLRLWMSVDNDGQPKFTNRGFLALEKTSDDARHGWGLGFGKPRVVEVEVRPVRAKAKR